MIILIISETWNAAIKLTHLDGLEVRVYVENAAAGAASFTFHITSSAISGDAMAVHDSVLESTYYVSKTWLHRNDILHAAKFANMVACLGLLLLPAVTNPMPARVVSLIVQMVLQEGESMAYIVYRLYAKSLGNALMSQSDRIMMGRLDAITLIV